MTNNIPKLLINYSAPKTKRGDYLFCEIRGKVEVGGYTDAPIPWPRLLKGGKPVLILCDELVEAVKTESAMAVAYWWGVHPNTVRVWRRALGVGRNTPGSRKLHQELFDKRIPEEARKRAIKASKQPEAIAKLIASKKGKPVHQNSLDAIATARTQPKSQAWKDKARESMREQWASGKRKHPQAWTPGEIALLGTDTDRAISEKTGRTLDAVAVKRRQLKINSVR